jgi:hypothetical protein
MIAKSNHIQDILRNFLLTLGIAVLLVPTAAYAQEGTVVWGEPTNISKTPQYSGHPDIVADEQGNVHVFWSENVGGEPSAPRSGNPLGNSILHTRWDGNSWSPPTDVLFVPTDPVAEFVAMHLDTDNRLHAVWTGMSNFYYSHAEARAASSGHGWLSPVIVGENSARSFWESDVTVDNENAIHIVYATRGNGTGVYYTASHDDGLTWTIPSRLSLLPDQLETGYSRVQITVDRERRLHAVWQTNQEEGFGQAVYYARSVNGGNTWSRPVQLAYRDPEDTFVEYPYLLSSEQSTLDLIYADGSNRGRKQRLSNDGGETWSNPFNILSEMEGINGYIVPLVDSAGDKHLIVNMRTRNTQAVGIYYAHWTGEDWSRTLPVDVSSPAAPSAHYTAATMRLGNEIHVVYNDIGAEEIWHVSGKILTASAITPTAVLTSAENRPTVESNQSSTQTVSLDQPNPTFTNTKLTGSSIPPLFLGMSLVLVLMASAFFVKKKRWS